jgi:ribose-phosphate pyrophosphokinase
MLDTDLAVVAKERPGHELAVAAELIGDVRGKRALILDDMVVTGRTLAAAADALHAAGAAEVRVCATHAAVTSEGLETLARSSLAEIVVTDTVALDQVQLPANVTVLGVSDLLAETIRAVFEGRSVSAIFAGQNELF